MPGNDAEIMRRTWLRGISTLTTEPLPMAAPPRAEPLKASLSESDSTRYLPSLTVDIEYMTTKKASSSVTRSP